MLIYNKAIFIKENIITKIINNNAMSENFEDLAQQYGQPNKKVKLNTEKAE